MYKTIKIGEKEYKLEFTMEASLYADCTSKLVEFLAKAYGSSEITKNISKVKDVKQQSEAMQSIIHESLENIANIPEVAMTLFYAGLLEHHGHEGDGTVMSKKDAKDVLRNYMREHENDGEGDFYAVLQMCIEQMGEDGFFKRIGLEKVLGQNQSNKPVPMKRKTATKA